MSLPERYFITLGSVPEYFKSMLEAQAPERFSQKFLESLGFTGINDRALIGILKELGFIDADGRPNQRYFEYLDKSKAKKIIATGIKEAFADLFAIKKDAQSLNVEEVTNKLRTLYLGKKSDLTIKRIAATFTALCEISDFELPEQETITVEKESIEAEPENKIDKQTSNQTSKNLNKDAHRTNSLHTLQYHINIVLPESRDQGVYDAIFKSLREHMG